MKKSPVDLLKDYYKKSSKSKIKKDWEDSNINVKSPTVSQLLKQINKQ